MPTPKFPIYEIHISDTQFSEPESLLSHSRFMIHFTICCGVHGP